MCLLKSIVMKLHVAAHVVHAVGSIVAIFAVSEDIAAPWVRRRLLSANRTIPDMTSANQPRVQIHEAVFNCNDFYMKIISDIAEFQKNQFVL